MFDTSPTYRLTTMTTYTPEQLATFPWIVSCDTLRAEDLLPKYWSTAETLAVLADRPLAINPETLASLAKLVGEDSRDSDWSDDEASQTLDDLTEVLNELAPCGFQFGSQEGDGACFGFWLSEDWAESLESCGFAADSDPAECANTVSTLNADGLDPDNIGDAYQGRAEGYSEESAGADFAQQLAEDTGVWTGQHVWPLSCIDWHDAWRELQMGDGFRLHDIGGGEWLVFRD